MYETMVRSRHLDDAFNSIYMEGKLPVFDFGAGPLPGELHPSNGQEPCAVGVCAALSAEDFVGTGHRPHHVAVARGVNIRELAAEVLGKKTGLSGGRGGHMHIYDKRVNFASSGIIAEGMGPAAGYALARRMQGLQGLGVSYIGDGAANQGAFHEVLNFAAILKLGFICVIEDNGWAVTVPKTYSTAIKHNSDRASAYGIVGEHVAGNDPDLIYGAAARAVERARKGEGPTLLELETHRLRGHFIPDTLDYMPKPEREALTDPIPVYRERLLKEGVLTEAKVSEIESKAKAEIAAAMQFARESPYPEPQAAMEGVFA
jgi:pyruvate dehydrogenase E1 component alpha subunit